MSNQSPDLTTLHDLDLQRADAEADLDLAREALTREGHRLAGQGVTAYRLGEETGWTQAYWGRVLKQSAPVDVRRKAGVRWVDLSTESQAVIEAASEDAYERGIHGDAHLDEYAVTVKIREREGAIIVLADDGRHVSRGGLPADWDARKLCLAVARELRRVQRQRALSAVKAAAEGLADGEYTADDVRAAVRLAAGRGCGVARILECTYVTLGEGGERDSQMSAAEFFKIVGAADGPLLPESLAGLAVVTSVDVRA